MKMTKKLLALILTLILALSCIGLAEEAAADETETPEEAVETEIPASEDLGEEAAEPEVTPEPAPEVPLKELRDFVGTHFMSFVYKIGDMWPMEGELIRYENDVLGVMSVDGELIDLITFRTGGNYTLFGVSTGMPLEEATQLLTMQGWVGREEDGWLSGAGSVGHRFDDGEGWMMILFADEDGIVEQVMAGTPVAALMVKVAEKKEFTQPSPTPEPSPTPDPALTNTGTVRVKSGVGMVNVRGGAGTSFGIVTQLEEGTDAEYLGEGQADPDGICWYKVKVGSTEGFVSAKFTTLTLMDGTFISTDKGVLQ